MGYQVDSDGLFQAAKDNIAAAVADGLAVETAHRLATDALRREGERQEFLAAHFEEQLLNAQASEDGEKAKQAMKAFYDRWASNCSTIGADARMSDIFVFNEADAPRDWEELFGMSQD